MLREAALLAQRAALSADLVSALVVEIRRVRTEQEQLAVVAGWAARPEIRERVALTRGGKSPGAAQVPRATLYRLLGQLGQFLERYPTREALFLTQEEHVRRAQELWAAVARRMAAVLEGQPLPIAGGAPVASVGCCRWCGRLLAQEGRGRPRRWCGDDCRRKGQAWRTVFGSGS